ncbi:MAG: hypothetical protein VYA67_14285 [Actinomycetota bacterium]|nr:hypothetical protein [Actinomycetota bacterium]
MTILKSLLLSALLAALGACAGTALWTLVLLASITAAHSFSAFYPATVCALVISAVGGVAACWYAWHRSPRSLRLVAPFAVGILLFEISMVVHG